MLNLVALKSSCKGTFLTKWLIATIVACSMLSVKSVDKSGFLEHMNSIPNGCNLLRRPQGRWFYTLSRHTGYCLTWWQFGNHILQEAHSHWPVSTQSSYHLSKYSVVSTMYHTPTTSAKNRIGTPKKALSKCKYPIWALNRMKMKSRGQTTPVNNITGINTSSSNISYNNGFTWLYCTPKA